MKRFIPALAAACFSLASAVAFAQAPAMDGKPGHHAERQQRMKAMHEACKDKPDQRACMTEQYCAKAADKAQCQAKAKERHANMGQRMDQRQAMAEACTGKRGDDLKKCYREQREKSGQHKPGQHGHHGQKG